MRGWWAGTCCRPERMQVGFIARLRSRSSHTIRNPIRASSMPTARHRDVSSIHGRRSFNSRHAFRRKRPIASNGKSSWKKLPARDTYPSIAVYASLVPDGDSGSRMPWCGSSWMKVECVTGRRRSLIPGAPFSTSVPGLMKLRVAVPHDSQHGLPQELFPYSVFRTKHARMRTHERRGIRP